MAIESTGVNCAVCKTGDVVMATSKEYRGDPMMQIIGPGSRNQLSTVTRYWCDCCGVLYHQPPNPSCAECGNVMRKSEIGHKCPNCGTTSGCS